MHSYQTVLELTLTFNSNNNKFTHINKKKKISKDIYFYQILI